MTPRRARALGCVTVVGVLVLAILVGGYVFLRQKDQVPPTPLEPRCVATANNNSVTVTREQAHYAAIIAGVSVRRGLSPRAATIALATAYQESGIRNLDHGDRDSLGLFQQRPSQDWGTTQQIMDPVYSAGKFYDSLVKIPDWESADINDTAQAVQRSGYPEAYRKHEPNARILASALTGHSVAGFSCVNRRLDAADIEGMQAQLTQNFGSLESAVAPNTLTVTTSSPERAWAVAHNAVADSGRYGVTSVSTNHLTWTNADSAANKLPLWNRGATTGSTTVEISFA